jgi:two-component system chemotaxis sensor kinase CheA
VIVVLQADTRRFGLIVDRVMDTEEIVVKPLTARLSGVGIYAGATLLGDGRVCLILDLPAIARRSLTGRSVEADLEPSALPSSPAKAAGQVLVVGVGGGRRVAIPLAAITRLERLSRDVVEQVGRREVLQYRSATVPLVRLRHLLGGPDDPTAGDGKDLEPPELLVVMSSHGARTVAIAVEEILGIVDDDSSWHSQLDGADGVGPVASTVLADRVTELLDLRPIVLSGDPSFFDDDDGDTADGEGEYGDRATGMPSPLARSSTPRSALRGA